MCVAGWHRSWQTVVAKVKEAIFLKQLRKEIETSCLVDCIGIRVGSWIETCKQHIPMLLCACWRRSAVLHARIIVLTGIKLASGERKEISIFVSNQIRNALPAIMATPYME